VHRGYRPAKERRAKDPSFVQRSKPVTELSSRFSTAWALALSPLFLFVPAFILAGMGPCTFSHPSVILGAFLLFIALEVAALRCFVRAARSAGKGVVAMIGMAMALLLLVLSALLEYYVLMEF
jgi:hypothetical protein